MASILDEYEDSLSRSAVLQPGCPSVGIPHSGYVNAQLEKEAPIFTKQRIDFTPSERITSLVVSCNQLCMSLGKDTLLRIDLGKANEPNHVELGRKDDAKVHKMFLDHTGSHLLIALSSTEVLYVNRNGQKVRPLARWKGQLVESVGWNKALGSESSTGPILVGTAQGQIFEAELSASEGGLFGPAPDLYFRPLYVLNLYRETREHFRAFLSSPRHREWLFASRSSIHELLASHGDTEHMVYFAVIMQDYERVVAYHCQHEAYEEALAVLARHRDPQLFYKFSPTLIRHIPRQLVDAWIEMGSRLDARKLIPALVSYSQGGEAQQVSQAIRYMEFCVNVLGETEQAIHNYLLSLYARGQPASLLAYLEQAGTSPHRVHYDLKYALRLCAEHGHHHACVHVYKVLELYEEAVDLALQVDVDLAKQCADLPEEDEELRKKLWLKIARHVVQEEEDVQTAMACLASCPLLKIEDVLPFFPDFVTIDHFKEAICSSLKAYNHHIQELQREMEEATASAQRIRRDLQELRGRYGTVEPQDKCATCDFPLLNRPFYLFLCGHMFHADCLLQAVRPGLPAYKQARLEELQRKLGAAPPPTKGSARAKEAEGGAAAAGPSREQLKADLDELVAAECVYCGELMIRSIDRPFIDPQHYEEEHLSWL
ncbi:VPS18 core subunit of CORVET and HOPS complexes [Phyllostomus discolor]|uniref:Vacuolar protein sorting-associated protein 18 homolog n=1 Tax=Phyllostomus discolor TaxID=89673 RepID=A0A834BJ21_9CHIR|nr:VPS18 core subunit of CORVET and HOPS complexes [Phyllostomus discolor]